METEKKQKKLKTTDLKLKSKKVKVMFARGTSRDGEILEIDRGLADLLEKKEKVIIIKK